MVEEFFFGSFFEGVDVFGERRKVFGRDGDDRFVDGRSEEILSLMKREGSIGEELNSGRVWRVWVDVM